MHISAHALKLGMARLVPAFQMLSAGLHAMCRTVFIVMFHILSQKPYHLFYSLN